MADQLRHRRLPGARARVVADVDGGVGLSSQQSVPEGQHLLAPINKTILCKVFTKEGDDVLVRSLCFNYSLGRKR